jgi:hypothetical protein
VQLSGSGASSAQLLGKRNEMIIEVTEVLFSADLIECVLWLTATYDIR